MPNLKLFVNWHSFENMILYLKFLSFYHFVYLFLLFFVIIFIFIFYVYFQILNKIELCFSFYFHLVSYKLECRISSFVLSCIFCIVLCVCFLWSFWDLRHLSKGLIIYLLTYNVIPFFLPFSFFLFLTDLLWFICLCQN